MNVYTFSDARQRLASVLDQAAKEGAVRIKRRDGQSFLIVPEKPSRSPLDVPGVDVTVSTEELVGIVREGRERGASQ
ncbi:MAG: type II toxin-antitoxin system Phd/YefM family antitoxin [Candidatus Schekmanbacteria bacterium]|nr:type II toxin-antitoxin system Phd/YefM family antitoxin [Candidatus Schekmanbacteria bacterium]